MPNGMLQHQARQHPFLIGTAVLIFGPYLLALALIFIAVFIVATMLEWLASR